MLKLDFDWGDDIQTKDLKDFIKRNKQFYDIFVEGISSYVTYLLQILLTITQMYFLN